MGSHKDDFVANKIRGWSKETLSQQAEFAAFIHGATSRWSYLSRIVVRQLKCWNRILTRPHPIPHLTGKNAWTLCHSTWWFRYHKPITLELPLVVTFPITSVEQCRQIPHEALVQQVQRFTANTGKNEAYHKSPFK